MSTVTRECGMELIRRRIKDHNEAAILLEENARPWWRQSRYAWLHAFIHRHAARQLTTVLKQIEIGIYEVGL